MNSKRYRGRYCKWGVSRNADNQCSEQAVPGIVH